MIHKFIGAAGFMLVILGVGCVDSPSMLVPITMIATGALLLAAYAGRKQKWTEK
mgnify:CR=1 FL=1